MVDLILDEERHNKFKHLKFWEFGDQASWYLLCGIKSHSWESFLAMPDFGWHSARIEDTAYSLKELYDNVEILQPKWNVSHLKEEPYGVLDMYYINPTKKEDTIIRHFCAGQSWKKEYLNKPIIF